MKKILVLIIISILSFNAYVKATDYAILISAGLATTDNTFSNSEYWYDLYLAYEDLILKEGYTHDKIIVFYGNGTSFNSARPRYQLALHNWPNIVDYDNNPATMNAQFAALGNIITNNDNLHIRWVVGHGGSTNQDDYSALIQNRNVTMTEVQIVNMINQIPNYNRRKIMWMTCHSGCLAYGNINLNNSRTVLITSSNWNQNSFGYWMPSETIHAQFNHVETSALYGQDPLGVPFNGDSNADRVISMWELWRIADISPIMTSDPQLGNTGALADKIYIDEGLQLTTVTFPNSITYWVDNFQTNNVVFPNTSNVTIDIDQGFNATGTFSAPVGTVLNIKP
ncbi:MAG: hypothetical protein HXX16_03910 [Bacteroidales bacterium]|nr:hypothetical protein [Bacteroidales bacterium]